LGREIYSSSSILSGSGVSLLAKATVMRNDMKAALQARFTVIYIEGDNKILVQALQGHIQVP